MVKNKRSLQAILLFVETFRFCGLFVSSACHEAAADRFAREYCTQSYVFHFEQNQILPPIKFQQIQSLCCHETVRTHRLKTKFEIVIEKINTISNNRKTTFLRIKTYF